jgi:hypothetical protein
MTVLTFDYDWRHLMKFDDTDWFTKRPNIGVDYLLVVNCGMGGTFKCSSKEEALKAIKNATNNGCGYGLSTEELTND